MKKTNKVYLIILSFVGAYCLSLFMQESFFMWAEIIYCSVVLASFIFVWQSYSYWKSNFWSIFSVFIVFSALIDLTHVFAEYSILFNDNICRDFHALSLLGDYYLLLGLLFALTPNLYRNVKKVFVTLFVFFIVILFADNLIESFLVDNLWVYLSLEVVFVLTMLALAIHLFFKKNPVKENGGLILLLVLVILSEITHVVDDFIMTNVAFWAYFSAWLKLSSGLVIFYLLYKKSKYAYLNEIRLRMGLENELSDLRWMLDKGFDEHAKSQNDNIKIYSSEIKGKILESLGADYFLQFFKNYASFLGLSVSMYEKNGAYLILANENSWCSVIHNWDKNKNEASDKFCGFDSAANSPVMCPEFSSTVIESVEEKEFSCAGGVNVYSFPIVSAGKPIAAINVSFSAPPKNKEHIKMIAKSLGVDYSVLKKVSDQFLVKPKIFSDFVICNIRLVAKIVGLSVELNEKVLRLESALSEKEVVLKEVHHRVKNNLQVIASIISMQKSYIDVKSFEDSFQSLQQRVKSMAAIHEIIYQQDSFLQIDFEDYIKKLFANYDISYYQSKQITHSFNVEGFSLDVDKAVPCALLINEIVSNSFKHAFVDVKEGKIEVTLKCVADKYYIKISDNGKGFDVGKLKSTNSSLGYTLIDALVEQLEGEINIVSENGLTYVITFK